MTPRLLELMTPRLLELMTPCLCLHSKLRVRRFERPPSFRSRDDHRSETDHRSKLDVRHSRDRYPDSGKGILGIVFMNQCVPAARVPGESRYTDRSGDTWHAGGGPVPAKTFGGGVPPRDSWAPGDRKPDVGQNWGRPIDVGGSDRWISGAGPLGVASRGPGMGGPGMYPGPGGVAPNIPGIAMGMSGGPYSGDRFDAYKQSMGPLRKY
uniref:Uncharacterized protein n=1 Tax=Timema genevievae TaxID=629358 RepID=A0A7R9JY33_TIMGE|nr:unnamed protein product [Timema genevievae]